MVDKKITQIIHANLKEYVKDGEVVFAPSNGILRYIFTVFVYCFEVTYYFMDDFYQIKSETVINNEIKTVTLLTKSKQFRNDIRLTLKNLKLSRKIFENHVVAFCVLIRKIMKERDNTDHLAEAYVPNLKFDGIFIGC